MKQLLPEFCPVQRRRNAIDIDAGVSSPVDFDEVESLLARASSPEIRPGLERIGRLLELLDNPQNRCPALHVVGTNGKGSTCAFLESVLRAAGYRTAFYSSPHLESPGERLLCDGRPLDAGRWMAAVRKSVETMRHDPVLESDPPSYFELVTASAFLLASEERAEVAVVEAGLGGRLDATNLLGDVACSVVASISMDHSEYLGGTLEEIAGEKFAVVCPGVSACYLGDNAGLIPLFRSFCGGRGALPYVVSEEAVLENVQVTDSGCAFDFASPELSLKNVTTRLIGRYQVSNAALALSALGRIRGRFSRLASENILRGMETASWPGRLEVLHRDPFVVLDGGHNPDGVEKLVESVRELWPGRRIGIVYAVMRDKDYEPCLALLRTLSPALYATAVPGLARSLSVADLVRAAGQFSWRGMPRAFDSPLDAAEAAMAENELVLICGSLYLIGWIRPRLAERLRKGAREQDGFSAHGPVL